MLRRSSWLAAGLLLLLLAGVDSSDFDDDDDGDVAAPAAGDMQTSVTIEGEFPNEQFVRFQAGKMFRVLLDGGKQQAIVKSDGTFAIYDVLEGVHTLEVDAPGWYFEQVKLDVHYKGTALKVRPSLNGENGGGSKVIQYPLQLEPLTRLKYFEEREKFDPTVYLKNPMVLMGLMMAFMAFVMPKMVENLDPEERKALQENMKGAGALQKTLETAGRGRM